MSVKVLVADDALFMREMIKEIIQTVGYEVIGEASNGKEAIDKFHELKPDVMTMDIVMPLKSGIEAVREIIKVEKPAPRAITSTYPRSASNQIVAIMATFFVTKINANITFLKDEAPSGFAVCGAVIPFWIINDRTRKFTTPSIPPARTPSVIGCDSHNRLPRTATTSSARETRSIFLTASAVWSIGSD